MTYRWSTMTNEHWHGFTQIDASFCLELNVFGVSQGVLIFYNIYLSQLSHFVSNRSHERFVSISQLLSRYVRRISVVFHHNFTRRDNQHVRFSLHKQPVRFQILRNFVVHKSHPRKTCLTEPLRKIIEPLRRNIEPLCRIIEPLRRNVEHHCEIIEPIQRNIWPHCGTIEPLRRKIEHLRGCLCKNHPLNFASKTILPETLLTERLYQV